MTVNPVDLKIWCSTSLYSVVILPTPLADFKVIQKCKRPNLVRMFLKKLKFALSIIVVS